MYARAATLHAVGSGLDVRIAQPAAFGIVGLVDAAAARWMDDPQGLSPDELTSLLSTWVWRIAEHNLRAGGIEALPDAPLQAPDLKSAQRPPEMRDPST